jgi:chemotaxis protein MotB
MAGKGGGAWKVAYADFVTAMMAFFMVMWLTSQKPQVKEAVAQYFRDPFAVPTSDPMSKGYGSEQRPPKVHGSYSPEHRQQQAGDGQPGMMKRGFAPAQFDDMPQITVLFPVGSSELVHSQKEHLKESISGIVGKRNRLEVRAHSFRKPLPADSPYSDHWDLCFGRCLEVKRELEKLGIDPDLIRLSQAEGNEPRAESLEKDALEMNSRVDVYLLPELVTFPTRSTSTSL